MHQATLKAFATILFVLGTYQGNTNVLQAAEVTKLGDVLVVNRQQEDERAFWMRHVGSALEVWGYTENAHAAYWQRHGVYYGVNTVRYYGNASTDVVIGNMLNVRCEFYGNAGHDLLMGGSANDLLIGGGGDDFLYGSDGDDFLHGGSGDDSLSGEWGDDVLVGQLGSDTLDGGDDDDDDALWGGEIYGDGYYDHAEDKFKNYLDFDYWGGLHDQDTMEDYNDDEDTVDWQWSVYH